MATVLRPEVTLDCILVLCAFFTTKVIGPGQNLLYKMKKFLLSITSSFALLIFE